jgi:hypothetical protein
MIARITYGPKGITCNDFTVEQAINKVKAAIAEGKNLTVSNFLIIDHMRILVAKGEIDCDKFVIIHNNSKGSHEIYIDETGEISDWPEGFGDIESKIIKALNHINKINREALEKELAEQSGMPEVAEKGDNIGKIEER